MSGLTWADNLDDLLASSTSDARTADESADKAWESVVEAFRRNDFATAKDLSAAFLHANHKASPYQLLGVQVMQALVDADNPTVVRDPVLTEKMKLLMSERNTLRNKYANLQQAAQEAEAKINKLTVNRTQPVQVGTAAYRECLRCSEIVRRANAEMDAMKPDIEKNKAEVAQDVVEANQNLKRDTLKLLDMLIGAGEIEAAFAITNVYTRVVGSDLDIAKKQQDVVLLQEDQKKADKIVEAITGEINSLLAAGNPVDADARLKVMMAKVETSNQSGSVRTMALTKLKPLATKVSLANVEASRKRAASAVETAELSERLEELETKLEKAQEYFGTLIRSIKGMAEYNGEFKNESERNTATAKLREKVKSGSVSKEKLNIRSKPEPSTRGFCARLR